MKDVKKILFFAIFSGFVFLFTVTNFNITINKQGVNITKTCVGDADAQTCVPIPAVATSGRVVGGYQKAGSMAGFRCSVQWGTANCPINTYGGSCTGGTIQREVAPYAWVCLSP